MKSRQKIFLKEVNTLPTTINYFEGELQAPQIPQFCSSLCNGNRPFFWTRYMFVKNHKQLIRLLKMS